MFACRILNLSSVLFVFAACAWPNHVFGSVASGRLVPGELLDTPATSAAPAQEGANRSLHIVVIAGDGAANVLNQDAAAQPVIQVLDKNNKPIAGAEVTVTAPDQGPSSVFLNGSHSVSIETDRQGRAGVVGMKPAGAGAFTLKVSAAYQGQLATAVISQTNYASADTPASAGAPASSRPQTSSTGARPGGLSTKTKVGIISGVAAAAVIGVVLALNHGGTASTAAAAVPTASISIAGTPTPGAPH